MFPKRPIAEILEYDSVATARDERAGIGNGSVDDFVDRSAKQRRAGQRADVHHPEDGFATESLRERFSTQHARFRLM